MLLYFALTLFVSATLLFLVQPMVGKMILPRLGGTPAVWNTCMVFFQYVLLVGYAYTHTISTWHSRTRQLAVQFAILLLPFLVLPFTLGDWRPPEESNPVLSVLWLLLGMVGLPFFVVATSAPLLQKWFAGTGHPAGKDPYFLYGASNLGSMLALLAYPVAVEPYFDLEEQARLWTCGYVALLLLVLGCIVIVWRSPTPQPAVVDVPPDAKPAPVQPAQQTTVTNSGTRRSRRHRDVYRAAAASDKDTSPPITWWRRCRWIGLAAVPSSLMLGVTTHLTTDISAIPLFWVIPLAVYLLTFILVFARWPVVWTRWPHTIILYVQLVPLFMLVIFQALHPDVGKMVKAAFGADAPKLAYQMWATFILHGLVFFVTTLLCHGELAKDRPDSSGLTEFYLCMSMGGVLGGMFNALLAPLIFTVAVVEYPLALLLACLLRPTMLNAADTEAEEQKTTGEKVQGVGLSVALLLLCGMATYLFVTYAIDERGNPNRWFGWGIAILLVAMFSMFGRPLRFALSLAAFLVVIGYYERDMDSLVFEDRSFFGFVRVRINTDSEGNRYHALVHGGINHGWEALDPARRRDPITYFHPTGGIGQVFAKFSWPDARLPASLVGLGGSPLDAFGPLVGTQSEPAYAVVGLGIGTLASHAKPYQHVRFYEIDPVIKHLSLPPDDSEPIFHYLHDARVYRGSDLEVVMGDGRLSLQSLRDEHYYHIIVLDAFSSDAIPVHLLTKEALELYLSKLAEGGVLVFNTTNKYVDIHGVLADLADDLDLDCWYYGDYGGDIVTKFSSDWVVLQRKNLGTRGRTYNGGPPMVNRVVTENAPGDAKVVWYRPVGLGGPVWTDRYSNLLSVIRWR